jgi:hypothetical protein
MAFQPGACIHGNKFAAYPDRNTKMIGSLMEVIKEIDNNNIDKSRGLILQEIKQLVKITPLTPSNKKEINKLFEVD